MNIITHIDGGAGKTVFFSAVAEAIKKEYPDSKLITVTAYPEVLLNNPFIDRVYKMGATQYFYDDHVKNQEVLFLNDEPYRHNGFFQKTDHIIKTWCDAIRIPYNGELPKIYINPLEEIVAESKIKKSVKPVLMFQPFGGGNTTIPYSWNRDIPPIIAQQIVDILKDKYHIVQIGRKDQPQLRNVEFLTSSLREITALLKYSNRRLLIDSFCQHAAMAVNAKSVVCWITNTPVQFGYDLHRNISANIPDHIRNTYIESTTHEFDFSGSRMYDFPFPTTNIFSVEQILNALQ